MGNDPPDLEDLPPEDDWTDTIRLRFPVPGDPDFEPEGSSISLGDVLGRGSMGTVYQARQRALLRTVAVKVPLAEASAASRTALIQEARIAGALEHPNIVPVHDLTVIDGRPHVVMKQIEGEPWSNLIGDDNAARERFGVDEPGSWHLGILATVCNAVEYAHSRGILHLDIKPANVMIGSFGAVYLVDWGVATRIASEDGRRPIGTPAYMAPEMAHAAVNALDEATDVYQLGAILHHLVLGTPPPGGLLALMERPPGAPPEIDPGTPLADLLRGSLHPDPAIRVNTVAKFRARLIAYLHNRGSERLLARANDRLNELEERLDASRIDRLEAYELFRACRFGFREALSDWPDAPGAKAGNTRALERMVRYELEEGDDRAAELLLERHPDPPQPLLDAIQTIRARKVADAAKFQRLQDDTDPRTAWKARALVICAIGIQWVVTPILFAIVGVARGPTREILISAITFILSLMVIVPLAGPLRLSRLNRTIVVGLIMAPGAACLMHVGAWLGGVDTQVAATIELFVYFTIALMVAVIAEWRIIPGAIGFLIAFLVGVTVDGTTQLGLVLAAAFLTLNAVGVSLPAGLRNEMPKDRGLMGDGT